MTIQSILEILERLNTIHLELIKLAEAKTPVLVRGNIEQLNSIVLKENKLVRQLAEVDRHRVLCTGEYLISRGYTPDTRVTISNLVKIIFKAEEKKALIEVQRRLTDNLMILKRLNEANQKLIEQSLAFIDFSIDVLVGDPGQQMVYQRPESPMQAPLRNGLFDAKA